MACASSARSRQCLALLNRRRKSRSSISRTLRGHHFAIFAGAQWGMLAVSQVRAVPSQVPEAGQPGRRPLAEADAVDIWIARWLRVRRKELIARYGCDPRRLYEIWEEKRFFGSRDKARTLFAERYPSLVERIDYGLH